MVIGGFKLNLLVGWLAGYMKWIQAEAKERISDLGPLSTLQRKLGSANLKVKSLNAI